MEHLKPEALREEVHRINKGRPERTLDGAVQNSHVGAHRRRLVA